VTAATAATSSIIVSIPACTSSKRTRLTTVMETPTIVADVGKICFEMSLFEAESGIRRRWFT
jgi:hypothetical protein